MPVTAPVTAALVVIGDEILSGRTRDANLPYLADWLNARGVRLVEARVVADDTAAIVEAVTTLAARNAYVFTTGGIGPTHDDITAAAVAKAFGVPLHRHPDAVAAMQVHYGDPSMLNEARLKMCDVPEGATLIANPVSAAPGFRIANVHVLAGIPRIMQAMLESLAHEIAGGAPTLSRTLRVALGEGTIAELLGRIAADFPDLSLGSYPAFVGVGPSVAVVIRGPDPARLDAAAAAVAAGLRALGGEPVVDDGAAAAD
jgi:molybdenum cofactor synthesis domain-containing protein